MPSGTLVFGARTCSAEEVTATARRVAGGLHALGIRQSDAVAVILRNDIPYFIMHEAAHYGGFDVVPVNWHLKPAEIEYLLHDCRAQAVVIHSDLLSDELAASLHAVHVIVIPAPGEITQGSTRESTGMADAGENRLHGVLHWADWLAQSPDYTSQDKGFSLPLFYTSGSSGRPKAVLRNNVTPEIGLRISARTRYAWGFDKTPVRSVMTGPLYHSAPNGYANMVLQSGGLLALSARFDAEALLAMIERHAITHLHLVPTMFVRLLALPDAVRSNYCLDSLVHVSHGAAPCPADVKRRMIDWWGAVIHEYYAMTETGIITCCSSAEWLQHEGTVGRAAPGVEIEIRDARGRRLKPHKAGIICVKHEGTDCVSYLNAGEQGAGLHQDGFLVTGDIGYLDEEGFLYISSRQSDMVISGGVNIYPAEIEAALLAMENIVDCAVFGIPDAEFGEKLVAVIESKGAADAAAVAAHLKTRLADFKTPKLYEFVERLPREDSGKIKKQIVRQAYLQNQGVR